MAFFPGQPG